MKEILYKELSYKLCGIAFEIMHLLGSGHSEKIYADAFEEYLKKITLNTNENSITR